MTSPEDHHGFNLSDIPYWVHIGWVTLVGLLWKGKTIGKAVVGVVTTTARLDVLEDDMLKVKQAQVTRNDIDVLRTDLQGTIQANQTATLSEIRFLFTSKDARDEAFKKNLEDGIFKKYEGLDKIIERLDEKVPNEKPTT
jgi:hypothetical protein